MVPNSWISPLGNQTASFVSTLWHSCVKWNYSLGCIVCTVIYSIAWIRKISLICNQLAKSIKFLVVWNRLLSHIFLKLIWGFGIGVDFLSLLILYFLHSSISTILHFWKPQAHQGTKKWGQPMKIQIFYDFENVLRTPFPFLAQAILCWMEV